jgi:hypothetical protein
VADLARPWYGTGAPSVGTGGVLPVSRYSGFSAMEVAPLTRDMAPPNSAEMAVPDGEVVGCAVTMGMCAKESAG